MIYNKFFIVVETKTQLLLHFRQSEVFHLDASLFFDGEKSSSCEGLLDKVLVISCCRFSCPSLIRAKPMTSFSDVDLNIQMSYTISNFKPPINVSTKAFCIYSCTRFPSFSNSRS